LLSFILSSHGENSSFLRAARWLLRVPSPKEEQAQQVWRPCLFACLTIDQGLTTRLLMANLLQRLRLCTKNNEASLQYNIHINYLSLSLLGKLRSMSLIMSSSSASNSYQDSSKPAPELMAYFSFSRSTLLLLRIVSE
jgi:hypothetical protein